jgi:type IV secretory pathway VirD2 relaxase
VPKKRVLKRARIMYGYDERESIIITEEKGHKTQMKCRLKEGGK